MKRSAAPCQIALGFLEPATRGLPVLRVDSDRSDMIGNMDARIEVRAVDGPAAGEDEFRDDGFRFLETFGQVQMVALDFSDRHRAASRFCKRSLGVCEQRMLVALLVHEYARQGDELAALHDRQQECREAKEFAALVSLGRRIISADSRMTDAAPLKVSLGRRAGERPGLAPKVSGERGEVAPLWRRGVAFGRADVTAIRGQGSNDLGLTATSETMEQDRIPARCDRKRGAAIIMRGTASLAIRSMPRPFETFHGFHRSSGHGEIHSPIIVQNTKPATIFELPSPLAPAGEHSDGVAGGPKWAGRSEVEIERCRLVWDARQG